MLTVHAVGSLHNIIGINNDGNSRSASCSMNSPKKHTFVHSIKCYWIDSNPYDCYHWIEQCVHFSIPFHYYTIEYEPRMNETCANSTWTSAEMCTYAQKRLIAEAFCSPSKLIALIIRLYVSSKAPLSYIQFFFSFFKCGNQQKAITTLIMIQNYRHSQCPLHKSSTPLLQNIFVNFLYRSLLLV